MVGREIPSIGVITAKRGRVNKINTGEGRKKRKTAAYTCRGLGLDAASSCCFCFFGVFHLTHLILGDQPVGLHGLLPLEEDHVVQRGEGQRLWSDATGDCRAENARALSHRRQCLTQQSLALY